MQHQPIRKFTAEHMAARERLLNDALKAGKIQLSSFQDWEREYDVDPENTERVIASLASAPAVAASASAVATSEHKRYEPDWLTEGERRRVTASSGNIVGSLHD